LAKNKTDDAALKNGPSIHFVRIAAITISQAKQYKY